jgi:hypothetical protein
MRKSVYSAERVIEPAFGRKKKSFDFEKEAEVFQRLVNNGASFLNHKQYKIDARLDQEQKSMFSPRLSLGSNNNSKVIKGRRRAVSNTTRNLSASKWKLLN